MQDLNSQLKEAMCLHQEKQKESWEAEKWNDYLNSTEEPDFLDLRNVNAYLSEWEDEDSYDESEIFEKCRKCLEIIDKLQTTLSVCAAFVTEKQKDLWKEGISSIHKTISKKLDYLSLNLLKDAEKHLNLKTQNMEYAIQDSEDDPSITLCLWANLYIATRKQGMSIHGFSFQLPMDIVQENCAVRLLHTLFDHVSPEKNVSEETEPVKDLKEICDPEVDVLTIDENDTVEEKKEDLEEAEDEATEPNKQAENEEPLYADENSIQKAEETSDIQENEAISKEEEKMVQEEMPDEKRPSSSDFSASESKQLPPPAEHEMRIVDPDEYFIVGGVFHFDLFVLPHLNVRKGNIIYNHKEPPKLRRIRYKRKIVPQLTTDGGTPNAEATSKDKRFLKEMKEAIFVQLQLSKMVNYLQKPEPARLFPEKSGYSKDCVYDVKYDEGERQITFKTNQFGIFGMLQKKYQNLPYKKWLLKGGDTVVLSLIGKLLEIDILITEEGYNVTFLHSHDNNELTEIGSTHLTADLLVKRLRSIGINIELGINADKFADISMKEKVLEDKVYDSIALLCVYCSVACFRKDNTNTNEIVLNYSFIKTSSEEKKVVIRQDEVIDFETELRRIEAAKAALEKTDDLDSGECEVKNSRSEQQLPEALDASIEESPVTAEEEQPQEVENEQVFSDLYHYVMNECDEKEKCTLEENTSLFRKYAGLVNNVRDLLRLCRPISSM